MDAGIIAILANPLSVPPVVRPRQMPAPSQWYYMPPHSVMERRMNILFVYGDTSWCCTHVALENVGEFCSLKRHSAAPIKERQERRWGYIRHWLRCICFLYASYIPYNQLPPLDGRRHGNRVKIITRTTLYKRNENKKKEKERMRIVLAGKRGK